MKSILRKDKAAILCGFAFLIVLSCKLTQEDRVVHTLSFDAIYDTLSQFDSVEIQLRSANGNFLGVLFSEKADSEEELMNLAAPGYDGKNAIISITGFMAGEIVYKVDRAFDGTTNSTIGITPFKTPNTSLLADSGSRHVYEGDTIAFPIVKVTPENLADTSKIWSSLDPELLSMGNAFLIGRSRGKAKVSVKLKSDLSKELIFTIAVTPNPSIPESLFLSPETLFVAAKGAVKKVKTAFFPITAKQGLNWHSTHDPIAIVSETGMVYGQKKGMALIWAESKIKAGVSDSVWVSVSERIPVTGMKFLEDTLNLFLGGSTEPLITAVTPIQANPEMDFIVRDPLIVELKEDQVKGIKKGVTWVVANSRDNPSLADSIRVEVMQAQKVDSVVVKPVSFQLYTGGKEFALTGMVYPASSYSKVQWKSLDQSIATVDASGLVSAVAPGIARIVCSSPADSLKKDTAVADVKQDVPELAVGSDTTVTQGQTLYFSPVVSQEYGGIARFKWDVNGESGWDDSAEAIKPISFRYLKTGDFRVAFYVRDGEGNWDTVQYKVTVKSSPMLVVIVSPGRDTLVNEASQVIGYTVNGVAFSETRQLQNGENIVLKDTSDEKGSGRDSIRITLDSTAPSVKIASPLPDQAFNKDSVAVVWSIDDVPQTTQLVAMLGVTDGKKSITREFTDAAGNKGWATVTVIRDTKPPKIRIDFPKDSSYTKNGAVGVVWFVDSVRQTADTTQTLTDGLNFIIRKATDAAGNTDSDSVRITYLSNAPIVKIISPSDSTVTEKKKMAVTWTVNGLVQKADTVEELKEGANTIIRSATDFVGQTGSDSVIVIHNPNVPIVQITSPISGTVTKLLAIQVVWTVNGAEQVTQFDSLLIEGENTLTRRFENGMGYEGVSTIKVIRDTHIPNPPVLSAPTRLITTQNPIALATWNWKSDGDNMGGAGMKSPRVFRYQLDGTETVTTSSQTFTLVNPSDEVHSLVVQEQDSAGNWSDPATAVNIVVDKTPPGKPIVTGESPSADPIWTWTSGGGGNGTYRYRMDGAIKTTTTLKRFNPHNATDAAHILYVQEQDSYGNWSEEGLFEIKMTSFDPTVPLDEDFTCTEPGSEADTVVAEMDSEGFRSIFDGKSIKGWWSNCKTAHSGASNLGAVFKVDPNSRALLTTQRGTTGGILMTNKQYSNYELVFDIWPNFGNDAGIFNRSPANGRCYQTTIDYIPTLSIGGVWGEGGFNRDIHPFSFIGDGQTLKIPGTGNNELSNWTTITQKLKATSEPNLPCPTTGCTQAEWQSLWSTNGWNQLRVQFYGGSASGTGSIHMKSWFRKSGAPTWVPLLQDTTLIQVFPPGYIGIGVNGGGRFGGAPGNWYRNIKIRELNDFGEPKTLP